MHRAEALMYTHPDSALQVLETIPDPEKLTGREQADYALLLTQARSRCRITATSDSLIRIATDYYRHSNDHARKATSFLYLGDVYMDMENHTEAIKALKQAEEVAVDADLKVQSLVYSKLGYLNKKISNYPMAWIYYQKALDIDKSIGHTEWIVSSLTNILNLPLPEVQDSVFVYVTLLEEILPSAHPDLKAKAYNNIGAHYYRHNQTTLAVNYFEKAIHTSISVPYRAYLNLARIYDSEGNIERADSLYQTALQSPVWATRARIYEALYKRHFQAKRFQEAATYMKLYQLAADSFYTHRQAQEIQELQAKYDYEVLVRKKIETENLLLHYVIGSGLLLLLSTWGIYYFKKQNRQQLHELENLIRQINNLENKGEKAQNLINELNESLSRHKVLSHEYLRVKGKWTDSEDILALGAYIRLKRDLSLYEPSSDLSTLGHWLDIVSTQFASRLQEKHPNLTASELNVCYLHRMNYSLHEIAQAMHVKPDSIKRYIYRACTNMGIIQSREEFTKYILKF
ncbi:MAG: tetratricopeptide repeat protein [Bacteroidaceae bacterium]|nr:tetratricopeptide repeat protein [Bacteroidaceae bacterium]